MEHINYTLTKPVDITGTCWDWCSEQHLINQANLEIKDLSFVVVALVS